jgi:hypothetical protein
MRTRPRRTKVAEDKAQQRRQRRDERAARRRRRQQGSVEDDDEALARRLQREYDDEARGRRRSRKKRRSEPTPQETIQQQTGLASPPTPRRSEVSRRESFGVRLKLNGETSDKLIASPPKVILPTPPKEGLTPDLDLEPWKADGWDALCLVCGDGGDVACCDGCPAVIHPTCAGLQKMPDESEPFFCRTCEKDRCGCCLEGPIRKEDHVVCGEERASMRALGCGRTFHLSCVELDKVPEGDWLCASRGRGVCCFAMTGPPRHRHARVASRPNRSHAGVRRRTKNASARFLHENRTPNCC